MTQRVPCPSCGQPMTTNTYRWQNTMVTDAHITVTSCAACNPKRTP